MEGPEPGAKRPRGRPNDVAIDEAILRAANDEFIEKGYHGLTMDSIAARAGVSKVSLYRRWKGKAAVMAELFRRMGEEPAGADSSSLGGFVRGMVSEAMNGPRARERGQLVLRTIGEIAADAELLALYREYLLEPRMKALREVVEGARRRGELSEEVTADAACAVIAGPLLLCHLALLAKADLGFSGETAESLSRAVLDGLGARA